MKASELIDRLQKSIETFGDLGVSIEEYGYFGPSYRPVSEVKIVVVEGIPTVKIEGSRK